MDLRAIGMGVSFALIWAAAFTAGRVIVLGFPPLTALVFRFVLSGVIAIALGWLAGQRAAFTREEWRRLVVFGICQNALYLGFNWIAMQWIQASAASIIASTMPLLVALAGWLMTGERLRPRAILGLVLGFAGVAVIMGWRVRSGISLPGLALCVAAAVALTVATLAVRGASSGRNVMVAVGVQMLIGAAALLPAALVMEAGRPLHVDGQIAAAMAFSVLLAGIAATWIWFRLVARVGAVRAATFHFLSPFLGVAIAALYLGEPFGIRDVIGASIIAAGIFLVQTARALPGRA